MACLSHTCLFQAKGILPTRKSWTKGGLRRQQVCMCLHPWKGTPYMSTAGLRGGTKTPVCPHHCRVKFRCLFPLCTQGGDQGPGCVGNFLTMQQSSGCSFQDRWCRGMRKGLSCKALLFPFYSDVLYHWYKHPAHTSRLCHIRTGTLSLTSLRHWFVPLQILVDLLPRSRS